MTIYSQHANRGKSQILATYDGPGGVASSTVTSLSTPALAAPIVYALNRISALTTVPLSVFDRRERRVNSYPRRHLIALTDRDARADLLRGTHSLWYEYVCLELHRALSDLDDAMSVVPPPVLTAVNAELETEARELRDALAEYSEGVPAPETENRRDWDFGRPFVAYDGGMEMLGIEVREQLDRLEDGISSQERTQAVKNLRELATAHARRSSEQATLDYAPSVSSRSHTTRTATPSRSRRRTSASGTPRRGRSISAAGNLMTPMKRSGAARRASQPFAANFQPRQVLTDSPAFWTRWSSGRPSSPSGPKRRSVRRSMERNSWSLGAGTTE